MSASQRSTLEALCRQPMTPERLASVLDARIPSVQRTLDALFRKSLVVVTDEGRWCVTERGRKRVGG